MKNKTFNFTFIHFLLDFSSFLVYCIIIMIENLKFIDELTTVENILSTPTKHREFNIIVAKGKIRELKQKYNKIIEDFENEYAPKENK